MKRLSNTPFAELLPPSIAADTTIHAAAAALDAVRPKTLSGIPDLLLWARLEQNSEDILPPLRRIAGDTALRPLSEAELDTLAWQLHVDGYELAQTAEAKRHMVLQSIPWHRIKGTPGAVKMLLEALGIRIEIIEWWTPEGKSLGMPPHTFTVRGWIGEPLRPNELYGPDTVADMIRAIETGKNVRSWLWLITLVVALDIPFRLRLLLRRRRNILRHTLEFRLGDRFDFVAADARPLDGGNLGHAAASKNRHVFILPRASARPERGLDRYPHFDRVRADFAPLDMPLEVSHV